MINWNDYSQSMQSAVSSTLENITFSLVEKCPASYEETQCEYSSSVLEVNLTTTKIMVNISAPTEFLEDIVDTLYPSSNEKKAQYVTDTLNEVNNTICGTFFRSLESQLGNFKLGIPIKDVIDKSEKIESYLFLIDDKFKFNVTIYQ